MPAPLRIVGVLTVLLGACSTTTTVDTESASCFEPCLAADANVDLTGQLEVATDITVALDASREVLAEYVDGALSLGRVAEVLAGGVPLVLPPGFSYEGDGVYLVDVGDGAVAAVQFYWPTTGLRSQLGAPIVWDVFDTENYFTGLSVTAASHAGAFGADQRVEFQFDAVGPGTELLGLGHSPQSPFLVDVGDMTEALNRTPSAARVSIASDVFGVVEELDISSAQSSVADISETALALSVDSLTGGGGPGSQVVALASADLSLIAQGEAYLGELLFSSASAEFSFEGRIRFEASADAEIRLGCPGTALEFPDEARVNEVTR